MEQIEVLIVSAIASATALILLLRSRSTVKQTHGAFFNQIESVAENLERRCLTALEALQRNVAALQVRADSTEQRISSFVDAPAPERKEQYEAALLLLSAGHSAARVATLLSLPESQVELVQDLRKLIANEKRPSLAPTPEHEQRVTPKIPIKRRVSERAKAKERAILLTDVVNFADSVGANGADHSSESNGATA